MQSDRIIGFDGSEQVRDALALGGRLAGTEGVRVRAVYVRPPIGVSIADAGNDAGPAWAGSVLDEARAALTGMAGATFAVTIDGSPARGPAACRVRVGRRARRARPDVASTVSRWRRA